MFVYIVFKISQGQKRVLKYGILLVKYINVFGRNLFEFI